MKAEMDFFFWFLYEFLKSNHFLRLQLFLKHNSFNNLQKIIITKNNNNAYINLHLSY